MRVQYVVCVVRIVAAACLLLHHVCLVCFRVHGSLYCCCPHHRVYPCHSSFWIMPVPVCVLCASSPSVPHLMLVSLSPFNAWPGSKYECSEPSVIVAFSKALRDRGLNATVRVSRGDDILAACGQLNSLHQSEKKQQQRQQRVEDEGV